LVATKNQAILKGMRIGGGWLSLLIEGPVIALRGFLLMKLLWFVIAREAQPTAAIRECEDVADK